MKSKKNALTLSGLITLSFIIKLIFIFKYNNSITLSSDDLNYIKSAAVLIRNGILTYSSYNEPSVFIMPLYPYFVAAVFRIFGAGFIGLQALRVIQALISCTTILAAYFAAKYLFNSKAAIITAFFVSFYVPNIVCTGYALTETFFTAVFMVLICLSLKFSIQLRYTNFLILGILWTAATLIRPTVGLYPLILFIYLLIYHKYKVLKLLKLGVVMVIPFLIIITPWWIRNYNEFGSFIPLTASGGNPTLQGTYIYYEQKPGEIDYYNPGKNSIETNRIEMNLAQKRIREGFKKNFLGFLAWYTLGKTAYFWGSPFYWQEYLGIPKIAVILYHAFLLSGFIGIFSLFKKNFSKYLLPVLTLLYFNIIHCISMAFDRYAFPLIPILTMFTAYFWHGLYCSIKKRTWSAY
jgi:4-amino-4-deoxy-L-arabinose transferase-like glycosyltransferase